MPLKKYSKFFGIGFVILFSVLLFLNKDKFIHLQGYGLMGLFILSIIGNATIILPMPIIFTAFIGGAIFNPLLVTAVISFGATIGEMTGYLAGMSGRGMFDTDARFKKIKIWMDKYGMWTIFVLAAVPNPFFDLAGIIAGVSKIKIYKYFVVVFLGKLIKFGIIAFLGANSVVLIDKLI